MGKLEEFPPSRRGLHNLQPTLMFDLERFVERIPQYDATTNPSGLINIAGSINNLMQAEVLAYSKRYILDSAETSLQYGSTAGSPELLDAIASYINKYFHPSEQIFPSQIIATNGVSALLNILAFNLCDAGEGVMYAVPEYGMFANDLAAQNAIEIIEVGLTTSGLSDRFSSKTAQKVVNSFRDSLRAARERGILVRMLIISNPCNPLGRCYSRNTLIALARFCTEEGLHFVSDEIYAMSSIARQGGSSGGDELDPFTSVLSLKRIEGVDLENIHCLSGASKDFGMGGLRLGYLVTRNQMVWKTVRKLGGFTWVNSFADKFFSRFLSDSTHVAQFLDLYSDRLSAAHSHAATFLSENNITYDATNSGIFLWVDLSRWLRYYCGTDAESSELQLAKYLIKKGVYLQPGEAFSSPSPGKFRLVFASTTTAILSLALHRLTRALKDLDGIYFQQENPDGYDEEGFPKKEGYQIYVPQRRDLRSWRNIFGCFV